jgi:hypothetical protein
MTALRRGDDHDALMQVVHSYLDAGTPAKEAYQLLHSIWRELGFNNAEEGNDLQENLE